MKKKTFPKFGNMKGMKKSIPVIREGESEAFILGNGRDQEFPLTPGPLGEGGGVRVLTLDDQYKIKIEGKVTMGIVKL